jgi:hypothetical protein
MKTERFVVFIDPILRPQHLSHIRTCLKINPHAILAKKNGAMEFIRQRGNYHRPFGFYAARYFNACALTARDLDAWNESLKYDV